MLKSDKDLTINLSIEQGNILSFDADVIALKYAQYFMELIGSLQNC